MMINQVTAKSNPVFNLTLLWAFNECALGGLMHGFKIPFTGIFVGGFAVILIGLIAHFSERNFRTLINSTFLVLCVKFVASPQSPVPAYFAVAFQGLFAGMVYWLVANFKIASLLFAVVAMLESAVQKLIIWTLIFGKSLWVALDALLNDVAKLFHSQNGNYAWYLLVAYLLIYLLWGLVLGVWLGRLPAKLLALADERLKQSSVVYNNYVKYDSTETLKRKKSRLWVYMLIALVCVAIIIILQNKIDMGAFLLRVFASVFIIFFVITPLVKWLIKRNKKFAESNISRVLQYFPWLRHLTYTSWQFAKENYSGIRRIKEFVFTLLVLVLYTEANNE
jgi:hypothetical protein